MIDATMSNPVHCNATNLVDGVVMLGDVWVVFTEGSAFLLL
jgi:hypothetical protein